jgi:hypothetical protein
MFKGKIWFNNLHYGIKVCAAAILFVLCWGAQKFFQEKLVTYLYSYAYQRCNRKVHMASPRPVELSQAGITVGAM